MVAMVKVSFMSLMVVMVRIDRDSMMIFIHLG